jgi:hypothetical protein
MRFRNGFGGTHVGKLSVINKPADYIRPGEPDKPARILIFEFVSFPDVDIETGVIKAIPKLQLQDSQLSELFRS